LDVNFTKHIIIIGWNFRSKSIIEELMNEDDNIRITIVDNIDHNPYNNKNISYIKGNPWNESVLTRANIKQAKTAIVLGDKDLDNEEMIDAKSVLICLAIDRLNPDIYLFAEVNNYKNAVHFERANVNDFIISNEIESKVLVRSVLYQGVNKAIKELITNSYGNELYEMSLDSKFNGKKYGEIVLEFLHRNVTIIGFYRNDKTNLNPLDNTILQNNDKLIYIANKKAN